jgi:hypothetical protein
MLGAVLAAVLSSGAVASPAPLDPGTYSPRTDAPVLTEVAHRWTCIARSRVAYGYGISTSKAVAGRLALSQCAIRTPRGLTCVLTSCR